MEDSDSEYESECFESAEESLDEHEDEGKDKIKKSFSESESEVVELVVPVSLGSVEREDASNNSLTYRKRPERLRRLSSKSPPKVETPTKVSLPSDSIFKTDKTATDVFFQDITSNLSKNINKSLNTLHQTSSNVKDLILSSLPVVSLDEKEGFSYDGERIVFPTSVDDENETQEITQNEIFVNDKSVDIVPSENNKKQESVVEEEIRKNLSDSSKRGKNISGRGTKNNKEKVTENKFEKENSVEKKPEVEREKSAKKKLEVKKEKSAEKELEVKKEKSAEKELEVKKEKSLEKKPEVEREKSLEKKLEAKKEKSAENKPEVGEEKSAENKPEVGEEKSAENKPVVERERSLEKKLEVKKEKSAKNKIIDNIIIESDGSEKECGVQDSINKNIGPADSNNIIEKEIENVSKEKLSKEILENKNFKESEILSDTCAQIGKDTEDFNVVAKEDDEIFIAKESDCKDDQINPSQPEPPKLSTDDSIPEAGEVIDVKDNKSDWDDSVPSNLEDSEVIEEKGGWDDFDEIPEESASPECNFEELKSVLKQMVPEEKKKEIDIKEKSLLTETQPEIAEVDESSKDGWDDFDFSDNEIENIGEVENKEIKFETSDRNKVSNDKQKELGSEKSSAVESLRVTGEKMKKEEIKLKKEKPVEEGIKQKETVEQNDWDWDGWDDAPPSQEKEVKEPMKNEKSNTTEEEFFSESRWSGWDRFGEKPEEKQGNWNIGSWGVNMLLNKATAVTQGISNVLEAGLGAPDPETLARMEKLEKERLKQEGRSEIENEPPPAEVSKKNSLTDVNLFPGFGITSLVAGVTSKIVEHSKIQEIGSKVISGGLDTLETFGKKTMEVLQEGDPGLKNKRALLLGSNKPVLSHVLKEAREKADRELKKVEEKEMAKKCHFETLFDDFNGMVHLEALEMLSRQCELKLEQIRSSMNTEEQEDLDGILEEVEQLCSLDDPDSSSLLDFKISLNMAVETLKDEISVRQIIQIHDDVVKWLQTSSDTKPSATAIHQKIVSTLAELTAATVHQFHKAGELLSVKECRKTVEEVDALSRMTSVVCMEIEKLCEKFIVLSKSNKELNSENSRSLAEKVNTVMKNSTTYIKQAFNLLIPVVQIGAAV